MGRVRKAAAVFEKIRSEDGVWPLTWEEIIILIEYQQLCNQAHPSEPTALEDANG